MLRPIEEQFEEKTVLEIRSLIKAFDALNVPGGPARYYVSEIKRSLETGLLLASLELAGSLVELFIRELVARHRENKNVANGQTMNFSQHLSDKIALEYDRNLMLFPMIKELEKNNVIKSKDAENIRDFYRDIRIPLHHGLPTRYATGKDKVILEDSIGILFAGRIHAFEEKLEDCTVEELKIILKFMLKYGSSE